VTGLLCMRMVEHLPAHGMQQDMGSKDHMGTGIVIHDDASHEHVRMLSLSSDMKS
jgi:hypothetical protein